MNGYDAVRCSLILSTRLEFPTFHQREQATLSVYSICYRKSNDIHGKCKTSFRFLGAVAIIMPQSSQKQSFHAIGEPMESQLCFL